MRHPGLGKPMPRSERLGIVIRSRTTPQRRMRHLGNGSCSTVSCLAVPPRTWASVNLCRAATVLNLSERMQWEQAPGRTVDDVSADSPHGPRPQGHRRLSHGRRKHRRSGPPSDPEACPAGARRSGCRWARSPSARGHRETDGLWVPMGRVNRTSSKSLVHHQFVGHRTRPAQGGTSTRISPTERRRSRRSPIFRRTARHGRPAGAQTQQSPRARRPCIGGSQG